MTSLSLLLNNVVRLVDEEITKLLPKGNDKLSEAMRYSALAPGKRLRPFVLINAANIFNVNQKYSLRAAAAIEITHCYSLIHDDLPAMDDDDFRRGIPSCHKKFDEATAILAGDALLTLAIEILSHNDTHPDPQVRCELIKSLTSSIGVYGMAGGQMLDLIYEKKNIVSFDQLIKMQYMKTAKLFMACSEMGAILGKATKRDRASLLDFGKNFGLAFQFIDDIEDIDQQKTLSNNNATKHIGKDKTLLEVKNYIFKAQQALEIFSDRSIELNILTRSIL